jgi:hypothetical protein
MSSITVTSGAIPAGTMIPIASNLTGAYAIPATGVVDAQGWMYCDGSAIPAGNTVSGTTPNLTDDRFLMGDTSAGTTSGANTINLLHSHTVNSHTHTGPSHTHSIAQHSHTLTAGAHIQKSGNDLQMETTSGLSSWTSNTEVDAVSTTNSPASWTTGMKVTGTANTAGATATGSAGTGATGSSSPGTSNQLSAAQDNRPKYFTCQYIIKVS